MARSTYQIYETEYAYFVTSSVVAWLPIFNNPQLCEILLDGLEFLQLQRGIILYSYVIMPHHLHLIAQSEELPKRIRAFKSFTAREIINYYQAEGKNDILEKLETEKLAHHIDSRYQVWQEGYHPKQIVNDKMMYQKIEYIHNNQLKKDMLKYHGNGSILQQVIMRGARG